MGDFWSYTPTPGVLTVVLALFAAVISMPPFNKYVEEKHWLRGLCTGVFFLIAAGEIFIIRHAEQVTTQERKAQNDAHLVELKKQDAQFTEQMASLTGIKESTKS
ncbi:MAG: hypothetical protein WBR10_19490, partial [Candidatus Acidiferrum sp.]